jgi:beta-N-acetylhexosaminidase
MTRQSNGAKTQYRYVARGKIGQLFCPVGFTKDEAILKGMLDKGIGGMMYRSCPGKEFRIHTASCRKLENTSSLAANLEAGGVGSAQRRNYFGKPCSRPHRRQEMAYRLALSLHRRRCCRLQLVVCSIVDIDMNFRNPITKLRTSETKRTRTAHGLA